jgi:AraC-like DNA-binding protein
VLAERFTAVVGMPPMHNLAKWRMQIASELLGSGSENVAAIAARIGYESDAAFSRAFKKMIGVPPSAWRRGVRVPCLMLDPCALTRSRVVGQKHRLHRGEARDVAVSERRGAW